MQYTVIVLVDGDRLSCNRFVEAHNLPYFTGLVGVELDDFRKSLLDTGAATFVQRDADGVLAILGYEEI